MKQVSSPLENKTTPEVQLASVDASVRRCLVSGESKPKSELVRFVLDPANNVVPDLAEKLPGRGLWVGADCNLIAQAVQKKLFSKSAKTKATASAELPRQVERLLARRCCDLLGLARTAGGIIMREKVVQEALLTSSLDGVILASNAGKDITKRLSKYALGKAVLYAGLMTREEMANALGREICAVVGLRPHPLARSLQRELTRWQGVTSKSTTPNGSSE